MSLLYRNIIKAENVKLKGKKTLKNFVSDVQIEQEDQQEINSRLEEELAKQEEEIRLKMEQAQLQYEEIINSAKSEGEKIIQKSNDEAMDIEKKAYEQGHTQGMKNGYEDGYKEAYEDNIEKAKNEASNIIENANQILLEAKNEVVAYMKENKQNILSLSVSIAEKVLREKFEDVSAMNDLIANVIEEYNLKENFVVKVNPLYKESIDGQILELKESHKINNDVFVLADESIEAGNAIIDNVNGRLTVGIDSVLEKIKEELL